MKKNNKIVENVLNHQMQEEALIKTIKILRAAGILTETHLPFNIVSVEKNALIESKLLLLNDIVLESDDEIASFYNIQKGNIRLLIRQNINAYLENCLNNILDDINIYLDSRK